MLHPLKAGLLSLVTLAVPLQAATDLQNEDLRRLIVNSVFWGLKLPVPTKADVAYVDPYAPSMYGFDSERKNFKVSELQLGKSLPPRAR